MKRICLAVLALTFLASAAAAQSLAELAKQEEARRKAQKAPAKVYTDSDLRKVAPATPSAAPDQAATTPEAGKDPNAAAKPAEPPQGEAEKADAGKDETWWRNRITEARAKVDRAKVLADAVQNKINSLTNDWSARDDPYQREQLAAERTRALGELQRLKDEIDAGNKAIADIEEEARQAGVPPGWLR